jgi:hypothetical protein
VGVLSRLLGNGVSAGRDGRVPDSDGETEGRHAPHPRLYYAGRGAVAHHRGGLQDAAATRGRIAVNHELVCLRQGRRGGTLYVALWCP